MFTCSKCDSQFPKWQGRCSECGAWGTVAEVATVAAPASGRKVATVAPAKPTSLSAVVSAATPRWSTGISELDRVLGGGIVPGSLILLGGDPGVGKSTLSLQLASANSPTLYASGEESSQQVKLRADRLAMIQQDKISFIAETSIDTIIATITDFQPRLAIIDSIQTVHSSAASGAPGTIGQITTSTALLMETAKKLNVAIIIVGHVTKEGTVAGPKTLEHLVDTVLYLEHDPSGQYTIARSVKNRFGSTGEIGVFEMTEGGLREISDPTGIFIDNENQPSAGTVKSVIIEGSRPFLVEIQALVSQTAFGYPQRKSAGIDLNRLHMLIAIMTTVGKLPLNNYDIYLNVAGGLKIKETATDLAVCLALNSALRQIVIPADTIALGEVGLSGNIRTVGQIERRLNEAGRLNIKNCICAPLTGKQKTALKIKAVGDVAAAIN